MPKKITLAIVDDNPDFVDLIRESLSEEADIRIVGIAYNGLDALTIIKQKKPQMMLLDMIMPEKDGLEVLDDLKSFPVEDRPITMMLTAIGQDHYIRRALASGAEYYFIKPFDLTLLGKRIRQIYHDMVEAPQRQNDSDDRAVRPLQNIPKEEIEEETNFALQDVSVPPHLTGYLYLKRSIVATILSEKGFIPATKELYPSIAEEFGTSPGKVERAIRGAIAKAWLRKDLTNASQYFTYAGKYKSIKPTNSEFVATMAAKVRQKLRIES